MPEHIKVSLELEKEIETFDPQNMDMDFSGLLVQEYKWMNPH